MLVPKKKRGRPVGLKNQAKGDDAVATAPKAKPNKSLRRCRAEESAAYFIEENLLLILKMFLSSVISGLMIL